MGEGAVEDILIEDEEDAITSKLDLSSFSRGVEVAYTFEMKEQQHPQNLCQDAGTV